jgi:ATP-binding cassette, subfamily B, bacterial
MRRRRPTSLTDTTEPLIGVDNLTQPVWVAAHDHVAKANLRDATRSLLKSAKLIARLGWRSAPGTTVATVALNLAAGCVTACGLLATVNVFTAILQQEPTPQRIVDSLPALSIVAAAYASRAALDGAVSMVEANLRPRVTRTADNDVTTALVNVELLAFEDADFRELARQGARAGCAPSTKVFARQRTSFRPVCRWSLLSSPPQS